MAARAYLFFKLAARLFDPETGLLATIAFAAAGPIAFAATDFRPYAFALASLIASTLLLLRWLETGKQGQGIAYAFLAALTVYFHYLFAPALLFQSIYAALRYRGGLSGSALLAVAATLGLLLLPALNHLRLLLDQREVLSVALDLSLPALLQYLTPPTLTIALLGGSRWLG